MSPNNYEDSNPQFPEKSEKIDYTLRFLEEIKDDAASGRTNAAYGKLYRLENIMDARASFRAEYFADFPDSASENSDEDEYYSSENDGEDNYEADSDDDGYDDSDDGGYDDSYDDSVDNDYYDVYDDDDDFINSLLYADDDDIWQSSHYNSELRPYARNILETLEYVVKSSRQQNSSTNKPADILSKIVSLDPQICEDVIKFSQEYPEIDMYSVYFSVLLVRPDLIDTVFAEVKQKSMYKLVEWDIFLQKILSLKPEYAAEISDLFLQEMRNKLGTTSIEYLVDSYKKLSSLDFISPEEIFATYELCIDSQYNDRHSMQVAFSGLAAILHKYPAEKKRVFELFEKAMFSPCNTGSSIQAAIETLDRIRKDNATVIPDILNLLEKFEKDKNSLTIPDWLRPALGDMYTSITAQNSAYVPQVLELLLIGELNENNLYNHIQTLGLLKRYMLTNPEYKDRILEIYQMMCKTSPTGSKEASIVAMIDGNKEMLEKYFSEEYSEEDIYSLCTDNWNKIFPATDEWLAGGFMKGLTSNHERDLDLINTLRIVSQITDKQPDLSDKFLQFADICIRKYATVNSSCLSTLADIAIQKPEYTAEIVKLFKDGVKRQSGLNDSIHNSFDRIVEKYPEYIKDYLEIHRLMLEKELVGVRFFSTLENIILNHPDLRTEAFEIFEECLFAKKNSIPVYASFPPILYNIVCKVPDFTDRAIALYKNTANSPYQSGSSIQMIYENLQKILLLHPEKEEQIFDAFKSVLQSDGNNHQSLYTAHEKLKKIVLSKPETSERVMDLMSKNNQPESWENTYGVVAEIIKVRPDLTWQALKFFDRATQSSSDLYEAYEALNLIVKNRPELATEVFNITKTCLQSRRNTDASLTEARNTLNEIVKCEPKLAQQVLELAVACEKIPDRSYLYKTCMRYLSPEKVIAKYPEDEQTLRIAYNGRFASNEEFRFALRNVDKKVLADPSSRIFHNQQADFTMLLEREAALNGILGKEICRYRHADASERVQQFYEEQRGWVVPSSFKTSQLFARKAQEKNNEGAVSLSSYLDKAKKCGLSPHDAVDMLPEPVNPEVNARVVGFIHRNLERMLSDRNNLNDLRLIINNWDAVERCLQNPKKRTDVCRINKNGQLTDNLDYRKVLKLCMSIKYKNQRSDVFAAEAADRINHVSAGSYHKYEDIYLAGLKVPEPFDSKKEFKCGDYTARFLPREDPRVGFFGNYTDCCQHYGGIGHDCAVSTVMQPFSQLFVVENRQGEIIAGSWAWENTEGKYREVCFDNIEVKGDFSEEALTHLTSAKDFSDYEMGDYVDALKNDELSKLWEDYIYWQEVKNSQKYGDISEDSAEFKKENAILKEISHKIDKMLQSKEISEHILGEVISSSWSAHKTARQHYESHKKVAEAIENLYDQAGVYLAEEANCSRVTIGKGRQDVDISGYEETAAIRLPKLYGNNYSDAENQVLLVLNPTAKPLDKSKESQRYVRDVCYLDIPAMEQICAEVFPKGDKELARPLKDDDLAGFVIEDREKGVVGYCLYENRDDNTYYISDTAVLDEYRGDKNASSKKLFAQLLRCVREKGGTWYAEMREETSLRYLKAMAARGLAKYDILNDREAEELGLNATRQMEYDPKLKVASMVYPVRFEVVRDDVRQATAHAHSKIAQPENSADIQPIRSPENTAPNPTLPRFTTKSRKDAENSA